MTNQESFPLSLKILAVILILQGFASTLGILSDLVQGHFSLNLFALSILAGIGLFVRTEIWSKITFFITCLYLVILPIAAGTLIFVHQEFTIYDLSFITVLFLVFVWLFKMLGRDSVKNHFADKSKTEAVA